MKKVFVVLVLIGLATSIKPFAKDINRLLSKQLFEMTYLAPQSVVKKAMSYIGRDQRDIQRTW